MKPYSLYISAVVLGIVCSVYSQGFIYDQQSTDETQSPELALSIQTSQPLAQSFTPSLSSIGFVRICLADADPGNNLGASVVINLLSNSPPGAVVASTMPVAMPDNFGRGSNGYVNLYFSSPVSVTPGLPYYLNPAVQSGDSWDVLGGTFGYGGGTLYLNGAPDSHPQSLWFREGIVVPEPTSAALVLVGALLLYFGRQRSSHTTQFRPGGSAVSQ